MKGVPEYNPESPKERLENEGYLTASVANECQSDITTPGDAHDGIHVYRSYLPYQRMALLWGMRSKHAHKKWDGRYLRVAATIERSGTSANVGESRKNDRKCTTVL